jgi:hypothetical protein
MSGPRDLTPAELQRFGLGVVHRSTRSSHGVTLIYCLHCGTQVSPDRREIDPQGWWGCVRKCNTLYLGLEPHPPVRPTP